jgi:lipid II:glycine glycyltransferase (peptidoglycan interpeptide bridge formation enzyme)
MKLQVIEHSKIDFKKWDSIILESDYACVFAHSAYLNATCNSWKALVLNDYEAVMPLTENKKYGFLYLFQPHFTPQLGVFTKNQTKEIEQLFLEFILQQYKFIDIECHTLHQAEVWKGAKPKTTYILNFENSFSFNQNTKRNCKKAETQQMQVRLLSNEEVLKLSSKIIHPFLKTTLGLKPKTISIFKTLVENMQATNQLLSFAVFTTKGQAIALAHFVFNEKQVVYLKGAQIDKQESSGAMHLLMRTALDYFKTKQYQWFDFGGGQNAAMAQFYKGFGAKPQSYLAFRENNLPYPLKWLKK